MKDSEKFALQADAFECDAYCKELHLKYETDPGLRSVYLNAIRTYENIARSYRDMAERTKAQGN